MRIERIRSEESEDATCLIQLLSHCDVLCESLYRILLHALRIHDDHWPVHQISIIANRGP